MSIWKLKLNVLWYIDTDTPIRYERIVSRWEKQDEQNMTYEQFLQDEELETENEQNELRKIADFVIDNNSTKENFFREIDTFLLKSL